MSATDALLTKYQLAPLPGNVQRLGKLIEGGFDRNADEIAQIIKSDEALSARVIRIATNGRKLADPMEIEVAVVRLGVSSITLIVMSDLLVNAVTRTFDTMLGAKLVPLDQLLELHKQVIGCIHFKGKANGHVFLRIPETASEWVVTHLMGPGTSASDALEMIQDIVGEMLNIVCGNFKSNLCDAGLSCTLMTPTVESNTNFEPKLNDEERHQLISLCAEGIPVLLDLVITPL